MAYGAYPDVFLLLLTRPGQRVLEAPILHAWKLAAVLFHGGAHRCIKNCNASSSSLTKPSCKGPVKGS